MPGLSERQLKTVTMVIEGAPDSAVRSLQLALSSDAGGEGPMAAIRDLIDAEVVDRKVRGMVLSPISGLCVYGTPAYPRKTFPGRTPALLWSALKAARPGEVQQATQASIVWASDTPAPAVFDKLLLACAAGLREPAGTPFAAAAALLDDEEPGGADLFASYLDLAPLARATLTRLPDWLGRMTEERAAAVRLAFRDATEIAKDAAPRFVDILAARLEEPWRILRIISAVMDRPQDTFLAASELAYVGESLLGQLDALLETLTGFDDGGGAEAGCEAAEAVRMIFLQIAEIEDAVDLKGEGPWGARVAQVKRATVTAAEALIARADAAVAAALPLKSRSKALRSLPRLDQPVRPEVVVKAEAMVAFVEKSRLAANAGGYAALRTRMIEKLDDRLDPYVEDLLDYLRKAEPDMVDNARAYLDIAARLIGLLRDQKAAQIVRRRAAA